MRLGKISTKYEKKCPKLGTGHASMSDKFSEKYQRGTGGVIFNPKINIADLGNFKQGFLIMKSIQKSNFRVQGMFLAVQDSSISDIVCPLIGRSEPTNNQSLGSIKE